jgi:hypothetical protein
MKLITRKRRRAFIQGYEFPLALKNKLRDELEADRPVNVALEGLREWYLACLAAGPKASLGMPSRAVDIAWHEMILMTRTYHHFCERAFGYYLHHSPEAVMDEPMRDSLARTLHAVEGSGVTMMAGVPLLFAIDEELGLEGGHTWHVHDIEQLRAVQPHQQHYGGHGGAGCANGAGCGGGGCGGGGCGGGG